MDSGPARGGRITPKFLRRGGSYLWPPLPVLMSGPMPLALTNRRSRISSSCGQHVQTRGMRRRISTGAVGPGAAPLLRNRRWQTNLTPISSAQHRLPPFLARRGRILPSFPASLPRSLTHRSLGRAGLGVLLLKFALPLQSHSTPHHLPRVDQASRVGITQTFLWRSILDARIPSLHTIYTILFRNPL